MNNRGVLVNLIQNVEVGMMLQPEKLIHRANESARYRLSRQWRRANPGSYQRARRFRSAWLRAESAAASPKLGWHGSNPAPANERESAVRIGLFWQVILQAPAGCLQITLTLLPKNQRLLCSLLLI